MTRNDSTSEDRHLQIGEVAERVGLSLRTIRYYEEIGLVVPSGRTDGGFRLYREEDVTRLVQVKALKPLGMPLDDLTDLLNLCESPGGSASEHRRRAELLAQAEERAETMARHLAAARDVLDCLSDDAAGVRR